MPAVPAGRVEAACAVPLGLPVRPSPLPGGPSRAPSCAGVPLAGGGDEPSRWAMEAGSQGRRPAQAARRVLHVIVSLETGGAENALLRLVTAPDQGEFANCVLSLSGEGPLAPRLRDAHVPLLRGRLAPPLPRPGAVWAAMSAARRLRPDIIVGWMYHGALFAELTTLFCPGRPPVIWNVRQTVSLPGLGVRPLTNAVFQALRCAPLRPAAVLYNSHVGLQQHQRLGFPIVNSRVVPNGYDVGRLRPDASTRARMRDVWGVADSTPVIGMLARYHPMKDHSGFFEAAARLARSCPEVRYVLAGRGIDKDNVELIRLITQSGLNAQVSLLGELTSEHEVVRVQQALDICVSSSVMEGFTNSIAEAMACGVPCVATDVGDAAHLLGPNGILVPPRQPGALAAAMLELVQAGPEGRARRGALARQRIVEEFSIASMVEQYHSLYRSVLASA